MSYNPAKEYNMPVVDMPIEELRTYTGTNPRPDDFDSYWESALAELDATPVNLELRPGEFEAPGVRCHHLYFTGTGGARIHAKLLRPVDGRPVPGPGNGGRPAVVRFHGYTMHSGDWASHLAYAGAGYVVAALDCRGQGGLSEDVGGVRGNTLRGHIIRGLDDGPEKLLFRHVFLDTVRLVRIVMELDEVDSSRVGVTGGSQGGGLTIACAALEPRVKLAAPVFPFLSDYKRVWDLDLDRNAYQELRDYFRRFDPTHERESEVFTRLGYIDVHHLAPRITAGTLMLTTLIDEVCPPSTQFAAFNAITAPKRMIIYPDFGHEALPGAEDAIFTHFLGL
jgi:cephalosporin-C deacetylase